MRQEDGLSVHDEAYELPKYLIFGLVEANTIRCDAHKYPAEESLVHHDAY
jgi:hypothetical protein